MKKKSFPYLRATECIRKMRGGSQSCLIRAEDGNFYIVKFLDNPQGSNILFNEAFGAELMRTIDIQVPKWCQIFFSDEFIYANPSMWFEYETSIQKPAAGFHFGSLCVSPHGAGIIYEMAPKSRFHLIANREQFVGVFLFDLWANQGDSRQAIFVQEVSGRAIHASFIDQGYLFGYGRHVRRDTPIAKMYIDPIVYSDLNIEMLLNLWESKILSINIEEIRNSFEKLMIPREWYTPRILDSAIFQLLQRKKMLGAFKLQIKYTLQEFCSEASVDMPHLRPYYVPSNTSGAFCHLSNRLHVLSSCVY